MLKYLKSSDPIAWLISPVLAILLLITLFFDSNTNNTIALNIADFSFSLELTDIWYYIIVVVSISITSILYIQFFNKAEFVKSNKLIAGFFYMLFSLLVVSTSGFHSIIISNLFLFLALKNLFSIYKQKRALDEYFMAGLWLGCASLFFLPWIALLPFFLFSILVHGVVSWRRIVVLILGSIIPYIYVIAAHFILDLPFAYSLSKIDSITFNMKNLPLSTIIFISTITILSLISLSHFVNSFVGSTIRSRSSKKLLLIISLGIILCMFLAIQFVEFNFAYVFAVLAPSFIAFSLMKQKTTRFTTILFYLVMISFVYCYFDNI